MISLKDKLLIRKFKLLNKEHLVVRNNFGINYWMWSDVSLDELEIPEGLRAEGHLYGPEPGFVEYYVMNDKDVKVGVLDVNPTLENKKTK